MARAPAHRGTLTQKAVMHAQASAHSTCECVSERLASSHLGVSSGRARPLWSQPVATSTSRAPPGRARLRAPHDETGRHAHAAHRYWARGEHDAAPSLRAGVLVGRLVRARASEVACACERTGVRVRVRVSLSMRVRLLVRSSWM
eukprot:5149256-Pleurochrysis_carterae.AAC.1